MAIEVTASVLESTKVYKVGTRLVSRTVIAQPEQEVIDNTDLQHEIKTKAGLADTVIFVSAVVVNQGYIGSEYFYELVITLDPSADKAEGHEHGPDTLDQPLRDAYRDGPYIDLDPTLGPVDIWSVDEGTVDYLRVRHDAHNFLLLDKDGVLTLGAHTKFDRDTIYDIGSADDGTTLYRPRDVYVGRDTWTARDGYFGASAQSPTYKYSPQLTTTPSVDPVDRLTYWNSVDNLLHVWDGTTDYALGAGGPTTDKDGVIFIANLTPNAGNIDCTLAENNTRVASAVASVDVSVITVHVFAYTGEQQVRPTVDVNGTPVVWTTLPQQDPTAYEGTVDLSGFTLPFTITATHQDGNTYATTVTEDAKPQISVLEFINGYPGAQTELKAGDTFDVHVHTNINFVAVEVENSGACSSMSFGVAAVNDHTFAANIANRGTTTLALPARVRVQKSTGVWSDWVYTNFGGGTVDGQDVVNLNNLYPSIEAMSQTSVTYPATQEAVKDVETVTVHSTCSDFDTIVYSSPTGELTVPNTTMYVENKAGIARNSGGYNISTANYRILANRIANNATTTEALVVYIAHDFVQIQMSEPASRLRTGGNDGTSAQDHTITLTGNQRLISTPTVAAPPAGGGTWQGAGFTGGPVVWTRALQCHDNDTVGTYSYGTLLAINLANRITTAYTGDSSYIIGGFVSRTLTLAAFGNETVFNAAVADYSKCTLLWPVKSLPNRRAFNTTTTPDSNSWCFAGTLGSSPTTARILDTAATGASSNATAVTVAESV